MQMVFSAVNEKIKQDKEIKVRLGKCCLVWDHWGDLFDKVTLSGDLRK